MTSPKEYCRWESFNVTCPPDGVIVVKSASYGRMRFTRCTELDMHLSCSSDVLLHLDDLCSGRRQCVVPVPNQVLHEIQPCPKDMQTYLEVDYECVKGFYTILSDYNDYADDNDNDCDYDVVVMIAMMLMLMMAIKR